MKKILVRGKRKGKVKNKDKDKDKDSPNNYGDNGEHSNIKTIESYMVQYNIDNYVVNTEIFMKNTTRIKYIISHLTNKNMIIDDLMLPSITTLVDKDKSIKPFWNNKIKNISDNIFLPTKHIMQNKIPHKANQFGTTWFDHNCIDTEKNTTKTNKFDINLVDEEINDGSVKKTKNIRIYMTTEQVKYMKIVIGTYRYFYNRGVSYINNYNKETKKSFYYVYPDKKENKVEVECTKNSYYSMQTMRKLIKSNLPDWILPNYPSHLIDQAFSECATRFKTCMSTFAKYKKPFNFGYKLKKNIVQTINLEKIMMTHPNCNTLNLFAKWKIENKYMFRGIKNKETIPNKYGDFSISFHKILGKCYINLPYDKRKQSTDSKTICAIDQGIITPFVMYSPKEITEIGRDCHRKIYKRCKELDIIQSRMSSKQYYEINNNGEKIEYKVNSKRKYKLREAFHRKIEQIKNMKDELHNKTIKYLTDAYKGIILPPFKTQDMAGKLTSKTARSLYNLSFFKFRTKLKSKAEEKNIKVYEYTEPYTSKTCGNCGKLNMKLGNSREFKCNSCNLNIDRDTNGARNIYLRNIGLVLGKKQIDCALAPLPARVM